MKRLIKTGTLIVSVVALLASCTMVLGVLFPNEFTVAGASYSVGKLHILNYGQFGTQNHYLDVYLVSDSLSVNADGLTTGTGDEIGFWLISATPTLGEGTFTWTGDFAGNANTMYGGRVFVRGTFNSDPIYTPSDSDGTYEFAGGSLTVKRTRVADDYILDFEGTLEGGSTVSAHYRGPLQGDYIDAEP